MGKIFTEKLKLSKKEEKDNLTYNLLMDFARVYKASYNLALDIQLNHRDNAGSYENQFMDFNEVLEEMKTAKPSLSPRVNEFIEAKKNCPKYDQGIIVAASRRAVLSFTIWWNKRLTKNSKSSLCLEPHYIKTLKDSPFFYTDTEVTSSRGGYLYISNIGRIKVRDLGYIPDGKYKNVRFSKSKDSWIVRLESAFDIPVEKKRPMMGNLCVTIHSDGSLQIGDTEIPSILESELYLKELEKVTKYEEIHNRKVKNKYLLFKEKEKSRDKLNYLKGHLNYLVRVHFSTIANKIMKAQPSKITLFTSESSNGKPQKFLSGTHRKAKTLLLVKIIKKKADLNGIKIALEGIDSSIFDTEKV